MKPHDALKTLVGGLLVAAACSASKGEVGYALVTAGGDAGAPGTSGSDGAASVEGTASADPTSGTRLDAVFLTTPDGAHAFDHWYDTQRSETCAFGHAADGQYRCLPAAQIATYWSDSACTIPIAPPSCASYIQVPSTACGGTSGPRFFAIQLASAPMTTYYASGASGGCTEITSGGTFAIAGAEIDPSSFVAAALK